MFLCWYKILLSSVHRYVWPHDRVCGISFIYNKNNNGLDIDPWGTPQFMVPSSKKTLCNETKNHLCVWDRSETILLICMKNVCISFSSKTFWSKISKAFRRSFKIIAICRTFLLPFKIMSLRQTRTRGLICSKSWLITVQRLIFLKIILNFILNCFVFYLWY